MIPFVANALQCIVIGEENPKFAPFPWDFVTLPEEDRVTAIGKMHKNLAKIVHVAPEIYWRIDLSVWWLGPRRFVTLVRSAVYKLSYLLTYLLTQTDTHRRAHHTILHVHSHRRSNNSGMEG